MVKHSANKYNHLHVSLFLNVTYTGCLNISLLILSRDLFRQIRAFATLLTMSADELSRQPAELDGPVAPIIVLYLMFGHADAALTSPHTSAGWSNEKLIEWLDSHRTERERYLKLVFKKKSKLASYRAFSTIQSGAGQRSPAKISHNRSATKHRPV